MPYHTYAPPGGYSQDPNDPFGIGGYDPTYGVEPEPDPNAPAPYDPTGSQEPVAPPMGGPSGATGAGSFQIPAWLQGILGGGGGMSNFLPALASAISQWKNADKYARVGREAAGMASPVDTETRKRYQQRMEEFYTDPTGFLERNPQFMATKKLGLGALTARNSALGKGGGATVDELEYISTLGSRFLDQEQKNLMNMGGFQFDPANGAKMIMEGTKQEIDARNGALRAMGYPFGGGPGGGGGGGSRGGGGPAQQAISQALRQAGMNPAQIAQIVSRLPTGSFGMGNRGEDWVEPEDTRVGSSSSSVNGGWDQNGEWVGGDNADTSDPFGIGGWDDSWNNINWDDMFNDGFGDWTTFGVDFGE